MNESLSALYMRDPETAAILRRQAMAQQLARAQNPEIMYRSAASPWVAGLQALAGNLGSYMAERDLGDLSRTRNAEANEFMANALAGVGPGTGQGASPQPQQAPQGAPARMGGAAIPAGGNYVTNTVAVENNPNRPDYTPDARNPRSSATGDGQFIDRTWLEFAAANPQRFQGMTRDQILAARGNPELSREAIGWYAQRNTPELQRAGVPVNDTTLALAHRFGPGDAPRVIQADPNTPMERIVSAQVMQANPDLQGRTAGQVVQQYGQRFGSGTTAAPQDAAPAGGQQAPAQAGGLSRERLVMAAMQGINSNNPVIAERSRQLLQMAQALPQAPQRQFTTAAPGSAIVDNQGNVVGRIPEAPDRTLETVEGPDGRPILVPRSEAVGRTPVRTPAVTVNNNTAAEPAFNRQLAERAANRIDTMQPLATQAAEAVRTAQRVQTLIDSGVITGTGAGAREAIERAFVTAGLVDGRRVANTGQLMSELANATLAAAGGLSGPTSDRDILFLREAAGGNIALTQETIRRIVQISQDRAGRTLQQYNSVVEAFQNDPQVPQSARSLYRPIEIPQADARPEGQQQGGIARPRNAEEMNRLPPGALFYAPDGSLRRRP